jgi:hypothetical protein
VTFSRRWRAWTSRTRRSRSQHRRRSALMAWTYSHGGSRTLASLAGSSTCRLRTARGFGTPSGRLAAPRPYPCWHRRLRDNRPAGEESPRIDFELSADYTVVEADVAWGTVKEEDFIGKDAHVSHRETPPVSPLCTLTIDDHRSGDDVKRYGEIRERKVLANRRAGASAGHIEAAADFIDDRLAVGGRNPARGRAGRERQGGRAAGGLSTWATAIRRRLPVATKPGSETSPSAWCLTGARPLRKDVWTGCQRILWSVPDRPQPQGG